MFGCTWKRASRSFFFCRGGGWFCPTAVWYNPDEERHEVEEIDNIDGTRYIITGLEIEKISSFSNIGIQFFRFRFRYRIPVFFVFRFHLNFGFGFDIQNRYFQSLHNYRSMQCSFCYKSVSYTRWNGYLYENVFCTFWDNLFLMAFPYLFWVVWTFDRNVEFYDFVSPFFTTLRCDFWKYYDDNNSEIIWYLYLFVLVIGKVGLT